MKLVCTCGHPESAHSRAEGPNSIGQFFWDRCATGWKDIPPYLVAKPGACECNAYRLRWWRPVFARKEE